MNRRIFHLLRKEWAQLRRDPALFSVLFIAPLIQLLIMGFAANTDVRRIQLAIRDHDHGYHSREFIRVLQASDYFETTLLTGSESEDPALLIAGRAGLLLEIPVDFGQRLMRREASPVQVLADGADSNFAIQGLNYLQKAARLYAEGLITPILRPAAATLPAITMQTRVWYNPELLSRYFMVPGIMAMVLMVTTMLVTSMALVKEREDGTLEQLIVTPLRPWEMIIGKLLPFVGVGYAEITFCLAIILGIFHVPLRGNLATLYVLSGFFLLTTLGLGLFISTLVKTQQQAMLVSVFFVMMPFILLSGFVFPIENMPRIIQSLTHGIPLKYYLIILRGLFLKGNGLAELWPSALILFGWGLGIFALASLKFHKRLD